MSTFEIKMTILSVLGQSAEIGNAQELYDWVMEEVEIGEKEDNVTHLNPVN